MYQFASNQHHNVHQPSSRIPRKHSAILSTRRRPLHASTIFLAHTVLLPTYTYIDNMYTGRVAFCRRAYAVYTPHELHSPAGREAVDEIAIAIPGIRASTYIYARVSAFRARLACRGYVCVCVWATRDTRRFAHSGS